MSDSEIKFGGDLRLYKNTKKIDYLQKLINSKDNHGIKFLDINKAKELFEKGNDILDFNISEIMFGGTQEDLKQTKVTQLQKLQLIIQTNLGQN